MNLSFCEQKGLINMIKEGHNNIGKKKDIIKDLASCNFFIQAQIQSLNAWLILRSNLLKAFIRLQKKIKKIVSSLRKIF